MSRTKLLRSCAPGLAPRCASVASAGGKLRLATCKDLLASRAEHMSGRNCARLNYAPMRLRVWTSRGPPGAGAPAWLSCASHGDAHRARCARRSVGACGSLRHPDPPGTGVSRTPSEFRLEAVGWLPLEALTRGDLHRKCSSSSTSGYYRKIQRTNDWSLICHLHLCSLLTTASVRVGESTDNGCM